MCSFVSACHGHRTIQKTGDLVQKSSDLHALGSTITSPKLTLVFDAEASGEDEDDANGDVNEDEHGNQSGRKLTIASTPQGNMVSTMMPTMSRLVRDQTKRIMVTSYFGDLIFLDIQETFDKVVGKTPIIIGTRPTSDNNVSCMSKVSQHADNCLLDVFMDLCCQDYMNRVDVN